MTETIACDIFTENKTKANIFNSHFCEQSNVDDTNTSLLTSDRPATWSTRKYFYLRRDVSDAISNINTTKARGPELIILRILKGYANELSHPLYNLF